MDFNLEFIIKYKLRYLTNIIPVLCPLSICKNYVFFIGFQPNVEKSSSPMNFSTTVKKHYFERKHNSTNIDYHVVMAFFEPYIMYT
jgi:hypothetical protein